MVVVVGGLGDCSGHIDVTTQKSGIQPAEAPPGCYLKVTQRDGQTGSQR